MIEVLQCALDSAIAPRRILRRHPHNEPRDIAHRPRTPRPLPRVAPLLRNQAPMPAQNRVRCHDRGNPTQQPSAEPMPFRCETATLVILQPQAVALQLLSENAVLFYEVLDDVLLVAVYPS